MLIDPRNGFIAFEDPGKDGGDIDILVVRGNSREHSEQHHSGNSQDYAYDKAYDRCEDLEQDEDNVQSSLDELPDEARSFYRDRSDDDFEIPNFTTSDKDPFSSFAKKPSVSTPNFFTLPLPTQ